MTDHYTEAHNALDDLLNVDDDAPHSKGRRDTLANVQAHALLALTDAVRALAPKDATDARYEREDTEARQDDLPNYGLHVAERDRADVAERMVEQLGDEVERLTRDLATVKSHRDALWSTCHGNTDADGNALVTGRADDVERIITTNAPRSGPDIQAFARLRRALDERGDQ